jgi:peptide/nickel transport system substrate-binding protein
MNYRRRRTHFDSMLEGASTSRLTRRDVLRQAMILGLSVPAIGALLAACGDDDDDDTPAQPGTTPEPDDDDDEETPDTDDDDDDDDSDDDDGVNREFHFAITGGIPDLDPQSAYDNAASSLFLATYEMLIRLDGESTFEYQPMLAREWEANEDQTEYTFTIPDNAMFHDGTICDADAVKTTFVRFRRMERGPFNVISRFVDDPENNIEVVDDVTVKFIMQKPEPLFLPAIASAYGPFVISPTAVEENATESDPYAHEWISQNMVGTGPYRVTEAEQQERFILDRFDDYHSEAPFFDRIAARVIPEDPTRRQLLEAGEIHGSAVLPPEDWIALRDHPNVQVVEYDTTRNRWVMVNSHLIPDPQARLAFAHAFPYSDVNEQVWSGFGYQQGPVADTLVGFDPSIPLHEYDLDRATELLTEGGVSEGDTFSFMFSAGEAPIAATAQLFQASLAEIGINLELQQVDRSAFLDLIYGDSPPEERPHFYHSGWWPDYNDSFNQLYPNFHSDSVGSRGSNGLFYQNADFDAAMERMELADTEEELVEWTGVAVNVLMWEDPAAVFYQQTIMACCLSADIEGFVPNGIYINAFNFHEMSRRA